MTTQQMPYEQSDVDATVVEYPSAPEAAVPSTADEILSPLEQEAQAEVSSVAETTHVENERQNETPVIQEEEAMEPTPAIPGILSFAIPSPAIPAADTTETVKTEPVREEPVSASAPAEPAAPSAQEQAAFTFTEEKHLFGEVQEEVRPFTDFIEEFRQAEARLSASLQESEDAFSLLTSLTPVTSDVDTMYSAPVESEALDTVIAPAEESESPSPELAVAEDIETPSTPVPSVEEQPASIPVHEVDETAETIASAPLSASQPVAPPSPQPPAERPVSPLLRPATRLRLPRHGSIRQREEEVALETPQIAPGVPSAPQSASVPTEAATEPEQPKPARRYRFDRPIASSTPTASGSLPSPTPASSSTPASPSHQQRAEENREKEQSVRSGPTTTARSENGQSSSEPATEIPPKQGTNGSSSLLEQQPGKQAQQEQPPVASPTSQAAPVSPTPPVTMSIAPEPGTSTPMPEPAAQQAEEIAPEDLPPLEYSELQKASSRRRRRHRAGSNSGSGGTPPANTQAGASTVKDAPATPQPAAPLGATPPVPAASSTPTAATRATNNTTAAQPQFNIVSGYTLNQMNQGSDASGPFMGPEPSPARGSVSTRDGRTTRAETQRSPVYAVRTPDVAPSVTSIQQLASVLSQAIQTQTDRMVAELRRANQVPTNISVSLPPFPSTERVGVFVDVANLLYSARTMRISIDFGKLLDFLRGNRRLIRAHAYCPTSPQPGDEQMFLQAVKGLGYRITTKNYKTFSSGAKKADLDLDLCMDVVRLVEGKAIDCVVLVSGDSDFMPMLDYCSDHGVRVEVAAFDEAMSATLRQSCDLFINLSMLEEVRL